MVTLTRAQRNKLLRIGGAYMREYPGVESFEVAEHVFGYMMTDPDDTLNLDAHSAIEISDYAYGVATFLVRERY